MQQTHACDTSNHGISDNLMNADNTSPPTIQKCASNGEPFTTNHSDVDAAELSRTSTTVHDDSRAITTEAGSVVPAAVLTKLPVACFGPRCRRRPFGSRWHPSQQQRRGYGEQVAAVDQEFLKESLKEFLLEFMKEFLQASLKEFVEESLKEFLVESLKESLE
ncbi:hypothetical protein RP20_CCG000854 [Aedes albopictus]|nr:hypothetical protein RP20_CCG000854 [Aedes albopictus]